MICEHCLNSETSVQITRKTDGETKTVALCDDCAAKLGFHSPLDETPFPLAEMLNRLFDEEATVDHDSLDPSDQDADFKESIPDLCCPNCQMTYKEFVRRGRFGCGQCYHEFRSRIENIMLKLHGASVHTGSVPQIGFDRMSTVQKEEHLQSELQKAIEDENYELAAQLRDELDELQTEEQNPENEPAAG